MTGDDWLRILLLGLTPVVLFLAALILMDSYKLVTRRSVAAAIAAGAVAASVSFLLHRLLLARGLDEMLLRRAVGPLVEETVKAVWVIALIRSARVGFLVDAVILGFAVGTGFANAQFVVFDPALTLKDAAIAALKELLRDTLNEEADRLYKMAKRLSAFADLSRYFISDDDTPKWRIHPFQFEKFLYANGYNAALNYGDRTGSAYEDVARSRVMPGAELAALADVAPDAEAAIIAELATLDAADSSIIAGTDQTGLLRYNGRKELAAIEALQDDALDPSLPRSTARG